MGQLMCCTYSDVLSLYFRWRDRMRFEGWGIRRGKGMTLIVIWGMIHDFRLCN